MSCGSISRRSTGRNDRAARERRRGRAERSVPALNGRAWAALKRVKNYLTVRFLRLLCEKKENSRGCCAQIFEVSRYGIRMDV